jgi:hypothetical protein
MPQRRMTPIPIATNDVAAWLLFFVHLLLWNSLAVQLKKQVWDGC